MRTRSILGLLYIVVLLNTSCYKETIRVSGEVVRTEVVLRGYTGLKISSAFNAHVSFSDTEEKIIVEANSDIQDRIIVTKEGNNLVIRLKRFTNIRGNATLNVYITTGNIDYYDISGASTVTLDNTLVLPRKGYIEISGASNFTGEIDAPELELDASGASDLDIYGNIPFLNAELSGASNLRDYDLVSKEIDMRLSGACNAFLSVSEKIDIRASGASTLNYKGAAVFGRKELTGASEVRNVD